MSRRMKVDMTGVESYSRCPEGQFSAKLVKLEECSIQGSGDDGLKAKFEVTSGSGKGSPSVHPEDLVLHSRYFGSSG